MKTKTYALRFLLVAILALALCGPAAADPAPFGLAIGKMTVDEFKKKYAAKPDGINKYSLGPMFIVDTAKSGIQFDGLRELTAIFGQDGKLMVVIAGLDKRRFDAVYDSLRNKYRLVAKDIPFVGNKFAKFRGGDTVIELDAPHLSFTMQARYLHQDFLKRFEEIERKEREEKRKKEQSQL